MGSIVTAVLAVAGSLTPAQWLQLLAMLPTIEKTLVALIPALEQAFGVIKNVVNIVEAKKATGLSHADAVQTAKAETVGAHGWTDDETIRWMDQASQGGF